MPRSLLWPDPRVKPPFGAAEIDWGLPLARALESLWLFDEGGGVATDRRHRNNMTPTGAAIAWSATHGGLGLSLNTSGATTSFYALDQAVLSFRANENFSFGFRFITTDTYGPLISLGNAGTGAKIDIVFGYNGNGDSAGRIGGQYRDNDFGAQLYLLGSSTVFTNGSSHSAVLTRSGSTITLTADGGLEVLTGTGSTAALTFSLSLSALGAQRRWILDSTGNANQRYLSADYLIGCITRRAWNSEECAWWHAEPYAMLRPIVRRRYSVPAIAAAAAEAAHGAMYPRMQRHIHQSWTVPR